jgi:predicted CXXCH cytochrome family protein
MKKTILLAAAFGLIAAGTVQAADSTTGSNTAAAGAGILNSKHDLSSNTGLDIKYNGSDPLDRVCIWCHAPHHTMVPGDAANIQYLPLWNHEVTDEIYQTYESDFGEGPDASGMAGVGQVGSNEQFADRHLLNATIGQPGGVSRLCLSCHDGTVAVNEYGRDPQRAYSKSSGGITITNQLDTGTAGQFMIGGNPYGLLNHHPVGFNYHDVALLDDEIRDPAFAIAGTGTPEMTTIGSLLYQGKMECVTCHDVHNSKNTGETFLWISDRQSAFCLTCHIK